MAQLIIHDLDDDVLKKLQNLAQQQGRSIEEEARDILRRDVNRIRLGSLINKQFSDHGLENGEDIFEWRGYQIEPPNFDE